jgi:hypothetical protein
MGNLLFWLGIGAAQKGANTIEVVVAVAWIEAHGSSEPGSLARCWYSGCPVDSCRNVYSVGQSAKPYVTNRRAPSRAGGQAFGQSGFQSDWAAS